MGEEVVMALWKKLSFWKHEAEAPEMPPLAPDEKVFPQRFSPLSEQGIEPSFGQSPMMGPPLHPGTLASTPDPELRVISAKLDTIKALLDVMNQRLDRLEGKKGDELPRWR